MLSLERLSRVYKRADSLLSFSEAVAEELLVRAWSNATFRGASSPFIRNYNPEKWLFLVGCFNSGTTVLKNIIASHPEISGMPREGVRFTTILSDLEENGHHMIWDVDFKRYLEPDVPDEVAIQKIKKDWGLFWKSESRIFLDKSIANTARINWLNRVFPNAYFIGIHRNGYCVTEGLKRRARPPGWYQEHLGSRSYSYETIANQWVIANKLMTNEFERMPNALTIRFEDLVANPIGVTQSCFEFLQLETDMLSQTGNTLCVHNKQFEIHNPNPASLDRLGSCGRKLSGPILNQMMLKLGYEL